MENGMLILVGFLLLIIGYLIGSKQKIELVHKYHYKNVKDDDKLLFCKGVGLGNVFVGIGMILFPIIELILEEKIALIITSLFIIVGLYLALRTIIKYNKKLF